MPIQGVLPLEPDGRDGTCTRRRFSGGVEGKRAASSGADLKARGRIRRAEAAAFGCIVTFRARAVTEVYYNYKKKVRRRKPVPYA